MVSEKRTFVRNTLFNGLAQAASMLASFIFMPALVKSFGIAYFGLYVLVSAVASYAQLLDFGIGTALTRSVAEGTAAGDAHARGEAIRSAFGFYVIVGATAAFILAGVAIASGSLFDVSGDEGSLLRNLLLVAAMLQLWQWPASTARHVLAGLQRYDVLAWSGLLTTALSVLSTLFVLASGRGPLVLMALNGASIIAGSAAVIVVAWSQVGASLVGSRASTRRLRAMFAFSWAVFVLQFADVLFYQQTDRLILGALAGAIAVGLYEASAKFNALITSASGLTVSAVLPVASDMDARDRHQSLRSLFRRGTVYSAALIAPMVVVIIVLAKPLLGTWLGPQFAEQAGVMQVLVASHALVILGVMGDSIVISKGKMGRRVPFVIAQAVLNVVLSVLLVPRMGVMGVAVGTAIAHLVDFPIHMTFLLREMRMSIGEWMRRIVAPVYPLLLVPAAIGLGLGTTSIVDSLPGVAAVGVVALLAYWLAFWRVGIDDDERHDIANVIRTFGARGSRAT